MLRKELGSLALVKKSGCADRAGSGAVYSGCCDRLGDCCPVSIGLPANLYQCCDSSKKEVCGGSMFQPTCTIDFTIPDPIKVEASKATPSPSGVKAPVAAPAKAAAPSVTSKCATAKVAEVTKEKKTGSCFRRCTFRGNNCDKPVATPYYPQPYTFNNGFYGMNNGFSYPYYSGLRQWGNYAYGLSYGLNNALPSALPAFNAFNTLTAPATTTTTVAAPASNCDSAACSCDRKCEERGDCCFDYCAFCVAA